MQPGATVIKPQVNNNAGARTIHMTKGMFESVTTLDKTQRDTAIATGNEMTKVTTADFSKGR